MYPNKAQLEVMYAERDAAINRLAGQSSVDVADLRSLDRLGRFKVAAELWASCTDEARSALLADEHPHVRSAAQIAQQ